MCVYVCVCVCERFCIRVRREETTRVGTRKWDSGRMEQGQMSKCMCLCLLQRG